MVYIHETRQRLEGPLEFGLSEFVYSSMDIGVWFPSIGGDFFPDPVNFTWVRLCGIIVAGLAWFGNDTTSSLFWQ